MATHTNTDTRPHPYSIARSYSYRYSASPVYVYETLPGASDTRPSSTSTPPAPATILPPTPSRSAPLAVRITPANRTRLSKPFGRLLTTHSLGCVGSSHIDDDHHNRMIHAHNSADVNERDFSPSFFEGMNKVDRASKQKPLTRTHSMVNTGLKSMRSWFASIGDHLTQPPMVEPPEHEQPYHYHKRSLRGTVSLRKDDTRESSPNDHNTQIAKRRAGALGTTTRAIESASYTPVSPCSIDIPDRLSGSWFTFDDIDSVSSRSIYSPPGSPAPTVHRVHLFAEHKEDKVEKIPTEAPQEYVSEQPLAVSPSDKLPASPLRPRITHARQDSLHKVVHRSPIRFGVPSKPTSEHFPAPLSPPPLPSRNPKRTRSDSGHGPLIHATLDRPFRGGEQDKLDVFTPGPRASSQHPRPRRGDGYL